MEGLRLRGAKVDKRPCRRLRTVGEDFAQQSRESTESISTRRTYSATASFPLFSPEHKHQARETGRRLGPLCWEGAKTEGARELDCACSHWRSAVRGAVVGRPPCLRSHEHSHVSVRPRDCCLQTAGSHGDVQPRRCMRLALEARPSCRRAFSFSSGLGRPVAVLSVCYSVC